MSRKPCSRKLRAADSSTCSNVAVRHGDRAGKAHVPGRRVDAAFGHVGDDRRDQRVAERARDLLGQRLARGRCACRAPCAGRSARCRRSARYRRRAGADRAPQLGPRQLLEEDASLRMRRAARRRAKQRRQTRTRGARCRTHRGDDTASATRGASARGSRRRVSAAQSRAQPRLVRGSSRAQQDVVVARARGRRTRPACRRARSRSLRLLVVLGQREQRQRLLARRSTGRD